MYIYYYAHAGHYVDDQFYCLTPHISGGYIGLYLSGFGTGT